MIRTYQELRRLRTFEERFDYLRLRGSLGKETFGYDRYLNQRFYRSTEWRRVRREVIIRDNGCDLGVDGYGIHTGLFIHHMNPITAQDLSNQNPDILDSEFLITVTHDTHNAIHYGQDPLQNHTLIVRTPNDLAPWRNSSNRRH